MKHRTVRLTAQGVQWHAKVAGNYCRGIDWKSRTGKLTGISRDGARAYVTWDGNRRRSEPLPMKFLEVVPCC